MSEVVGPSVYSLEERDGHFVTTSWVTFPELTKLIIGAEQAHGRIRIVLYVGEHPEAERVSSKCEQCGRIG